MSCQVSYLNPQNLRCDVIPLIIYTGHSIDIAHSFSVKLNISQSRIAWRNPCIPSSTLSSLEPLWSGLCLIFNLVLQTFSADSRVAFVWGSSIVYSLLVTPSFRMIVASLSYDIFKISLLTLKIKHSWYFILQSARIHSKLKVSLDFNPRQIDVDEWTTQESHTQLVLYLNPYDFW